MAGKVHVTEDRPGVYSISRPELARVINAVRDYADSGTKPGHLVPYASKAGPVGLRLAAVGPRAQCGLELGDTILTVDGIPVTDNQALEMHVANLPNAHRIILEVERQDRVVELVYNIE